MKLKTNEGVKECEAESRCRILSRVSKKVEYEEEMRADMRVLFRVVDGLG